MSTINYYDVPSSELYRVPGLYHGHIECICSTTEEPQYANFNDYEAKDSEETSPRWKCGKCKAVLVLAGDTGTAIWYPPAKEEEFWRGPTQA